MDGTKKKHQCGICYRSYVRRDHLRRHENTHFGGEGIMYDEKSMISASNSTMDKDSKKKHQCGVCNKSFSRGDHLKRHSVTHFGGTVGNTEKFPCSICNKTFSRKDHVKRHQWVHTGEKLFFCNLCNNSFSRSDHLKKHLRKHQIVDKPFYCNTCHKSFVHCFELEIHLHEHIGIGT